MVGVTPAQIVGVANRAVERPLKGLRQLGGLGEADHRRREADFNRRGRLPDQPLPERLQLRYGRDALRVEDPHVAW
jgi:hypothetical protein